MAKRYGHFHKYKRTKLGEKGFIVYRCMVPGCSHYKRKELMAGQLAQCWRCGEPFVITDYKLRLAKPHCDACVKRRPNEKVDKLKEILAAEGA